MDWIKENIASIVLLLVVIAIGGTLAWFAHNTTSSVDQMGASVTAPTDDYGFDGEPIEYCPAGTFTPFGGTLTYVPGKNMIFRLKVDPHASATVELVLEGDAKPKLGNVIRVGFYDEIDGDWCNPYGGLVEAQFPRPTATLNSLAQTGAYGWTVTSPLPTRYNDVDNWDYLYFFLYMDPAAGEEPSSGAVSYEDYQNLELKFKVRAY